MTFKHYLSFNIIGVWRALDVNYHYKLFKATDKHDMLSNTHNITYTLHADLAHYVWSPNNLSEYYHLGLHINLVL